ncbi:16S rRNA (guanine(966)-N(2))-methyltransferase RsmD [Mycoplasma sp. 480]|uniref:16S rRNA (guanine(966)-N(2))-methyltransferase RsmD n=1 Tax=Mycoplasma sp. 480 TaxID=3440155 RepID=UPI003F519800
MLRIIAGNLRGRKIEQPDLEIVRPTTDKTREAIFSSIQFEIEESLVLDLFGGSGAVSFEFISRGAKEVFLSEKNRKIFNHIVNEQKKLKIQNMHCYNLSALQLINMKKDNKFNFIFLDPPYEEKTLLNETLKEIANNDILLDNGQVIVETNSDNIEISEYFEILKEKKYGKTYIYFLGKK